MRNNIPVTENNSVINYFSQLMLHSGEMMCRVTGANFEFKSKHVYNKKLFMLVYRILVDNQVRINSVVDITRIRFSTLDNVLRIYKYPTPTKACLAIELKFARSEKEHQKVCGIIEDSIRNWKTTKPSKRK